MIGLTVLLLWSCVTITRVYDHPNGYKSCTFELVY